jgi:hypothetical protein
VWYRRGFCAKKKTTKRWARITVASAAGNTSKGVPFNEIDYGDRFERRQREGVSNLTKAQFSVTKLSTTGGFFFRAHDVLLLVPQMKRWTKPSRSRQIFEEAQNKWYHPLPRTASDVYLLPGGGHHRRRYHLVMDVERFEKL